MFLVNAISPGPIDTPIWNGVSKTEGGEQIKAGFVARCPLGRLGKADEIAKAAVFLASDDSSFVTGTELFVDGGAAKSERNSSWSSSRPSSRRSRRLIRSPTGVKRAFAWSFITVNKVRIYFVN